MSLPARDDVDPAYRFDLTRIFERPAAWDAAADTLGDRLADLDALTDRSLDSAADLRDLLELTEECHRRKQRLDLYATLRENVNAESDAAEDRLRRLRDLESEFEPVVAAVLRRLRETDDDRLGGLVADLDGSVGDTDGAATQGDSTRHDGYRRYAEALRSRADRARSPAVEDVIASHDEARSAPTRILQAARTEDFDPPEIERPDGETVEIRHDNYRDELSHSDRDYRRRAYEAYRGELDRFEHVLARAFAEKLAAADTEAEVRGYDSVRDRDFRGTYPETGAEPALPGAVHDAMLDAVRANLGPYHRAQRTRRDRLGVETLRPWDRAVSLADSPDPAPSYEEATTAILAALEPLGDDYVARTRSFFEQRRIDAVPTQNKRTDITAYCPSSAADGAFVLANYRADVRSASILCHELGHALNVEYHREGPTRYATCPRPVSEIPSILHEILLAEHWIAQGGALADHAADRLLELLGGNFYNAAMYSAFAHRLATAVGDGESLSAERIRGTYADLLAEFRPEVAYDDRAGRNWLGWGTREPYCSFQYVLGATGALVVRDRLREGSLSPEEYRDFLRNTGRTDPLAQFERIGIDVTTADPYERAAETFAGYVDDL